MIKVFLILLLCGCTPGWAQVNVTTDVLPETGTTDSTTILNNNLRLQQNALNSIGAYFNSSGFLQETSGGTGANLALVPNGSILMQNTANVGIGTFGQGTSGQVLTSNGPGVNPIFSDSNVKSAQIFTSSGSFVAPTGITKVYLSMIGGGGTGGVAGTTGGGGGGGSGQCFINYPYTVVAGNSYTVTINGAGATTVFDALTAAAGTVGNAGSGGTPGTGGVSGGQTLLNVAGSGLYNGPGGTGGTGTALGGGGAGSPFGSGGAGGNAGNGVAASANTGAGGGGGSNGAATGGAGGSGVVIVSY